MYDPHSVHFCLVVVLTNVLLMMAVAEKSYREKLEEMIEEQRKPAGIIVLDKF